MRAVVLSCLLLAGCSTDTYGLGADLEASVTDDTAGDDTSISGDDTAPLFDADDDSTTADSADSKSSDTGVADVTVDAVPEVAVDVAPEVTIDAEPEVAVDAATDVAVDAATDVAVDGAVDAEPDIAPIDTGTVDTGTVTPFTPDGDKVVCADGSGGTKLCAAGQTCCGSEGTYTCKSSCGLLDKKYRCDEKADCGGQVCCAIVVFGSYEGSECRESWLCLGTTLCQKDGDCVAGKKCEPFKPSGAPYTMGRCP